MRQFKCNDCGAEIKLPPKTTMNFCIECGSNDVHGLLGLSTATRLKRFENYKAELNQLAPQMDELNTQLNELEVQRKVLKQRFDYLLMYFARQVERGLMSKDELTKLRSLPKTRKAKGAKHEKEN